MTDNKAGTEEAQLIKVDVKKGPGKP